MVPVPVNQGYDRDIPFGPQGSAVSYLVLYSEQPRVSVLNIIYCKSNALWWPEDTMHMAVYKAGRPSSLGSPVCL